MKIKITKDFSDWFIEKEHNLILDNYTRFYLSAIGSNLTWTLFCVKKSNVIDKFDLSTRQNIHQLIKDLNITHIQENIYCKLT